MNLVFLFVGVLIGAASVWLITKAKTNHSWQITPEEITLKYVSRQIHEQVLETISQKEKEILRLNKEYAHQIEKVHYLEQKITESKTEVAERQKQMQLEFKALSNQIFEDKSQKFLELNEKKVQDILIPLRERIKDFEKKVDDTHKEDIRERISLKKELEQIMKLNQQVSKETNDLTNALKSDKKFQGDWGEQQLEQVLQKAGLEKDIHYVSQKAFQSDTEKTYRPDFIINLPDNKNIIIDAKMSLVAYERYHNEEDDALKINWLKNHLQSVHNHIKGLSVKNYQNLYNITSPDYVLMYVPLESALFLALRNDASLFDKALEKNIVLVSVSTLLATLRTISFIWKQENQKKNVLKIAKESGALYDKFVGFVEDLITLGRKIDGIKTDYNSSMNKLYESKKKGDTIIGRIENIKKLGAATTKSIPQSLIDRLN